MSRISELENCVLSILVKNIRDKVNFLRVDVVQHRMIFKNLKFSNS